jgi:hypothetical protein
MGCPWIPILPTSSPFVGLLIGIDCVCGTPAMFSITQMSYCATFQALEDLVMFSSPGGYYYDQLNALFARI